MVLKSARRAAFTILEILIAIVVLVLGITGIIALFPTAIESGNKTVEDTYAATITQSVVDAIAVGLRESRYTWRDDVNSRTWTYFVFNHDGVLDPAPGAPENFETGQRVVAGGGSVPDEIWKRDYFVLLPQSRNDPNTNTVATNEPIFVYPLPALPGSTQPHLKEDQRSPSALANPGGLVDNFDLDTTKFGAITADGTTVLWIPNVYRLGRYREPSEPIPGVERGEIRPEYRGGDLLTGASGTTTTTGGSTVESIALDPYPTYSFCFAIKRARVDTAGGTPSGPDGVVDANDPFSNSLYELRVMIFKNFDVDEAAALAPGSTGSEDRVVPKTNVPIRTFITLISI
jgi:type II secretory pathway pseudopilin PulG